jgi:hypothetical protein
MMQIGADMRFEHQYIKYFFVAFFLAALQPLTFAQQLAFPGAEGAGRFTTGGRGTPESPTTVFKVTSLADNNVPGTLRYAVSASQATFPHRTIVFVVSGTIHLTAPLSIRSNTTIAGQTAPGDGICIADYPVSISGNNVILRYVRIRMGDKNQNLGMVDGSGNGDALGSLGYSNIIVDHCSISWSSDEACTIYRGDNLTLQWNIVSEPLNYSYHFEAGGTDYQEHGYGGIWGARKASFHHNVIAHAKGRMPRFAGSSTYPPGTVGQENVNFYNNVVYNWQAYSTNGGEGGNYNIINNYYKYGPNTSAGNSNGVAIRNQIMNPSKSAELPYPKIYMDGNFVDGSPVVTGRNWLGVSMSGGSLNDTNQSKVATPFDVAPYTLQSATDAFESVLKNAGATLPRRDTLDRRIINDIRFRTGKIIDVQGGFTHGTPYALTVNAWPSLGSVTAPVDTDNDGMPDAYELANGLNPNNAADRAIVTPDGYTNLESYLNGIVNTFPEIYYSGVLLPFQTQVDIASGTQQYAIEAMNLTGNVVIKAPAGFEVSADNGVTWFNYAQPLVLSPTGNALSSVNLLLRLLSNEAGDKGGFILHYTDGGDTTYVAVNGKVFAQNLDSDVLLQWPFSVNNQDDASVRHPGLNPSQPVFSNLYLSNGTTVASVPAYGTTHGQAFGPTPDGSALWTAAGGGSGSALNRNYYEEFVVTTKPGFGATIDSIILNASFYNSSSGTRFAIVYSKSGFAEDSANVTGGYGPSGILLDGANGAFGTPVLLGNQTGGNTNNYRFALNLSEGIVLGAAETLTVRMYFSCGSTSPGRYAKIKDVQIKGKAGNVLPLGLRAFNGWEQGNGVALHWEVFSNEDVAHFEIERSNLPGNYEPLHRVNARNVGASPSYQYHDAEPKNGNVFYRLNVVGKDGTSEYSRVVLINRKLEGAFLAYPNPAATYINLSHPVADAHAEIQVVNAGGQVVLRQNLLQGAKQTSINVEKLRAGKYNIILRNTNGTMVVGFLKL